MIQLKPLLAVETMDGPAEQVSAIEQSKDTLRWVTLFPEGQQNIRSVKFDLIEPVGEVGLAYSLGGKLVAYVCIPQETLLLDDPVVAENAWKEYLRSKKNKAEFEEFLKLEGFNV